MLTPALCLRVARHATGPGFHGLVILDVDLRSGKPAWMEIATAEHISSHVEAQQWAYDAAIAYLGPLLLMLGGKRTDAQNAEEGA